MSNEEFKQSEDEQGKPGKLQRIIGKFDFLTYIGWFALIAAGIAHLFSK